MDIRQIKEIIVQELPRILQEDVEMQGFILRLSGDRFAGEPETETRFDRLLCFINADIMLTSKFVRYVHRIPFRALLMAGGRCIAPVKRQLEGQFYAGGGTTVLVEYIRAGMKNARYERTVHG